MRRALLLMLAIVLPLKSVAAVVVPITGAPDHRHAAARVVEASAHADAHAHCEARADRVDHGNTLHEHSCPHLAMALIAPGAATSESQATTPRAAQAVLVRFASIVLDVPRPPPTVRP